jgi:hypothetical protein
MMVSGWMSTIVIVVDVVVVKKGNGEWVRYRATVNEPLSII